MCTKWTAKEDTALLQVVNAKGGSLLSKIEKNKKLFKGRSIMAVYQRACRKNNSSLKNVLKVEVADDHIKLFF